MQRLSMMPRSVLVWATFLMALATGLGLATDARAQKYDWEEAAHESFWYARYNLDALHRSGMGVPLPEEAQRALRERPRVDGNALRLGPGLMAPFITGNPAYAQAQTESYQWSESHTQRTVTTAGLAWTVISASKQAMRLARRHRLGMSSDGATLNRVAFFSLVAGEAARFAQARLRLEGDLEGLYGDRWTSGSARASSDAPDPEDQISMLWALAELTELSRDVRSYRGRVSGMEAELWASTLFRAMIRYQREHPAWLGDGLSARARGHLIEALAAYAEVLGGGPELERVVRRMRAHARTLAQHGNGRIQGAQEANRNDARAVEIAASIRALIVASRMTADEALQDEAIRLWESLQARWDGESGVYGPSATESETYEYSARDVGDIVGAFSAVIYGAGLESEKARYAQFFQSAVKRSRLMAAEREEAGGDADGDIVPLPGRAGGPHGSAPVFRRRVQYDPGEGGWIITDSRFETSGALYLATRLMELGEPRPSVGSAARDLPQNRLAQFEGLRQQVARLRADRASAKEVEALKQLLVQLEARMEDVREQIGSQTSSEGNPEMKRQLSQLADEVSALSDRVETLEDSVSPGSGSASLQTSEIVTIALILLIVISGLAAYQWVLRRAGT